jgi:hypothetical protein
MTPVQSSLAGTPSWQAWNVLRLRPSRRHRAIPRKGQVRIARSMQHGEVLVLKHRRYQPLSGATAVSYR